MGFKIKNKDGFTLIEVMMVVIILGILSQMALTFVLDLRARAYDGTALSDGKNLMTAVAVSFLALEDVDFTQDPSSTDPIGAWDNSGDPRPPVFTMSPGVRAEIVGESRPIAGSGFIDAFIFHTRGTDDGGALSGNGKREFYFSLDEMTSAISAPEL
jgi:prepilin-type N-terminal cleavage/methylation domain-containing protein